MEEIKRIYIDYVYYNNKDFIYSFTYYSLICDNNKYYWRRWNIKYNCWFKILDVTNSLNMDKDLRVYLKRQYYSK